MINIKDVWSVWRKSATTDKDMQRYFKRACTPKACHDVLIELETANQKIENIQIEIQEKHCKLHAALKLRDTANERVAELEDEAVKANMKLIDCTLDIEALKDQE